MRISMGIRASAMVLHRHAGTLELLEARLVTRTAIVDSTRMLARDLQRLTSEIASATQAAAIAEADLANFGDELDVALEGGMAGGAATAEWTITDAQVDAQLERYRSGQPVAVPEPAPAPAAAGPI